MKRAFLADEIFDGKDMVPSRALLLDEGRITGIVSPTEIPSAFSRRDFPGCFLAPSFIDIQIYGGNGRLFSHSVDSSSLDATAAYCAAGGCSHFMITMATNAMSCFMQGIEVVREYISSGKKGLLGLHLEGPWISPAKRGAHIEAYIKKPGPDDLAPVLEKGKGVVRMVTLAPEECDDEIIRMLIDHNIIVSAGHSNAGYARAREAFRLGIPAATHLFNAMSPLQGREPGMVGAIYDDARAMASIICDGVHVDFNSVRISKKMMGERLFFITDAVTEIREGSYQHIFRGDRFTLPVGTLSGSCMTMISTLRNAVQKAFIPLEESLRMCSSYPAKLMGEPGLGNIKTGTVANFNIIRKADLELAGSVFYGREPVE